MHPIQPAPLPPLAFGPSGFLATFSQKIIDGVVAFGMLAIEGLRALDAARHRGELDLIALNRQRDDPGTRHAQRRAHCFGKNHAAIGGDAGIDHLCHE